MATRDKSNRANTDAWKRPLGQTASAGKAPKPSPWRAPLAQVLDATTARKARRAIREVLFDDNGGSK